MPQGPEQVRVKADEAQKEGREGVKQTGGRRVGLWYLQGRHELQWDQRGRWDQLHPEREGQEAQVSCAL